MQFICLKTNSEQEFIEAFPMFRHENQWIDSYGSSSFLYIGEMYKEAACDENDNVITPPVLLDGFHANMINRDNISIPEEMIINPTNIKIKWAGQ